MIKLFIADDEQIVIDSIKFIIEKNDVKADIIGFAKSGREAIEKVEILKPDVVFMDIKMPGIDGIEAIKQIKERHKDIIFVIITAYEYFNYAKEAIDLGVLDYLLKPLNRNKVVETIKKAIEVIEKRREAMLKELELKEKLNKIIPYLEGQFLYTTLFSGITYDDLSFYEDVFGIELKRGYAMIVTVEDFGKNIKDQNLKLSIEKQNFYDYFKTIVKNIKKCLIGPYFIDKLFVYFPVEEGDSFEIKNNSIETAQKIIEAINQKVKIPYRIGMGRVYSFENILKSYYEAEMALKMAKNELIVHFDDIAMPQNRFKPYPINKERLFIDRLMTGDLQGSFSIFNEIYEWMVLEYQEDVDKIKSKLIEIIGVIKRNLSYYAEEENFIENRELEEILKINDVDKIKFIFINTLKNLFDSIKTINKEKTDTFMAKIIRFIEDNFNKDITLDDVAKEVNMSYHYFSKFFKDQTRKNFIDYLTNLRVTKAKELLEDETVSIKEVCYKVGYSDPNYFSKIFKKATGMTPTEYRLAIYKKGGVVGGE